MTDHPIIFSAGMVHALLSGRKTQHRVPLKPQPEAGSYRLAMYDQPRRVAFGHDAYANKWVHRIPYAPGDRIWVKETHSVWADAESARAAQCIEGSDDPCIYRADFKDGTDSVAIGGTGWRSPVTMPRWASRLTLIVTDVRVQRVQDINRGDAMGEGCPFPNMAAGPDPREWFRAIWNSIHGPDAWAANPWVAALTFTTHHQNIDQMEPPND